MEAPRGSEGTVGPWASPFEIENWTAFNPQSPGYRRGLQLSRGQHSPHQPLDSLICLLYGGKGQLRMP